MIHSRLPCVRIISRQESVQLVTRAIFHMIIHPSEYLLVCIFYVVNASTPLAAMHMSASIRPPWCVRTLPYSAIVAGEQVVRNGMFMNVQTTLTLASAASGNAICHMLIGPDKSKSTLLISQIA